MARTEPFPDGSATCGLHGVAQLADGCLECAAVVFFLVGFAVAFEATALVDVEQGAGKFLGQQGMVEPFGTQGKRVGFFQCLAGRFVLGKEAMAQQGGHHAVFAFEQPVSAAAQGAFFSASCCKRSPYLTLTSGLPPVTKDPHTGFDDSARLFVRIEPNHAPAQ